MNYIPPKQEIKQEKMPFNTSLRDALGQKLEEDEKIRTLKKRYEIPREQPKENPHLFGVGLKRNIY